MRLARVALTMFVAVGLSACATRGALDVSCPGFAAKLHQLEPSPLRRSIQAEAGGGEEAVSPASEDLDYLVSRFAAARNVTESPVSSQPAASLVLSGGGQWGAFGAHFLTLLPREGASATDHLPEYDIVTGVSTGGLQTLFLAIGTDRVFAALRRAYLPTSEREIVDRGSFITVPLTGSLAGLGPLRRRIEQALCTDEQLAQAQPDCVLVQLRDTRRVPLIGFIEAASGAFEFVDVRDFFVERSLAEARSCIVGAALASAAMPVFFQQVRVDGRTYFDGGVRLSLFLERQQAALARVRGERVLSAPPPLYIVRNGPTDVDPDKHADRPKRDAIVSALRAEQILVNQTELSSIEALRLIEPRGPIYFVSADRYRGFADAAGNRRTCTRADEDAMFDPSFMRCLADLGTLRARGPVRWRELPPLP